MLISIALEGYWLDREIYLTDGTAQRYKYVFDRFTDYVGDVEVNAVTTNDVKRYIRHLTKETSLSSRSVYDHYCVLSTFWTWANRELGVDDVIKGKIDKPKYTKRKIDPIPMSDVKKLVDACEWSEPWKGRSHTRSRRPTGLRDKAIIITMVDCGIRVSALCDLKVSDYDGKRLHIQHAKGDKERFLPLGNAARKAIWRYLSSREDLQDSDYLFATWNNTRIDRNSLANMLKRLAERVGVKRANPHRFRHTFAIEFLRNGGNPFELQELLGHETLKMVMNYVALAETDIEKAQKRSSPADKWRLK